MSIDTNKSAVAVIVNDDGEWLCVTNRRFNCWALPGGKVEGDESFYDACVREVKEEVDLTIKHAYSIYDGQSDTGRIVRVWWVTRVEGVPRAVEAGTAIKWMSFPQLLASNTVFKAFYVRGLMNCYARLTPTEFR